MVSSCDEGFMAFNWSGLLRWWYIGGMVMSGAVVLEDEVDMEARSAMLT